MPDPTGQFTIQAATDSIVLSPALSLQTFEASPFHTRAQYQYNPSAVSVLLRGVTVLARQATVGLTFEHATLSRASICVHLPGDGSDWSDWSHAQEMRRKHEHDRLAQELFGTPLAPRTIEVNAKPVERMFPDEEWPRAASFPWGEVISGYDSKGGFSEMWIRWRPRGR